MIEDPSKVSAEAAYMADERERISALMGGTGTMRAAGKKYLPQSPAESQEAYSYRLAVSTLYNGLRRTVETLAGKPFSEAIETENVADSLKDWLDDVDLQGRDLHSFAHAVFKAALEDGLSHILVDYPQTLPGATLAEKRTTGARPYFVHLRQSQILGWRSERIEGVETLTQLRIMESVTEPEGQWATRTVPQIRILEPTRWETRRKNEREEWVIFAEGEVSLGAIPLSTIYTDRVAFMQARPPLLDLAYLNIEHWQSSSDQSNILHVARVPILFASGFQDGTFKIGAGAAITNDDPAAKLIYVEHTGAAIGAGRESLKDLEERMSLMGAQLLVKKPGARTATEKAIDSADADSALSLMVRNLEDSLEYALQFMADWEGLGPAGEVELVGEIGGLEDMEIAGLMKARELGLLSAETVFHEMQRRGLISDDMQWPEELARLKGEGVPVAVGGSFESPGFGDDPQPDPSKPALTQPKPETLLPGNRPHDAPPAPVAAGAQPKQPQKPGGAAATPDFGPLIDSIGSLVEALGKPEQEPAPIDFAGLIDAIRSQPAPVINVTTPAVNVDAPITVNVPEQPASVVNVAPPSVTVEAPQFTINPPAITVESPTVNVTPAPITVESPTINVQPPAVTVIQQKPGGVDFETDATGEIIGAKFN